MTVKKQMLLYWGLLLLFGSIQVCKAINCYVCNSKNDTDKNCHDPFHPAFSTYTTDCMVPKEGHMGKFPANFCLKMIGKTYKTGEELVIRTCTLDNMDNQCGVFRFENDTLHGCILTCDFDGCNGASSLVSTSYIKTSGLNLLASLFIMLYCILPSGITFLLCRI